MDQPVQPVMKLIQSGPRSARVVAVGESPGKNEMERGIPFVGAAGELLDRAFDQANKALGRIALRHDDVFITNICHIQPPGNDFDWFVKPKPRPELMLGIMQLKKDIEEIKPNLVIALGAWPLKILAGKDGISKWRGSILESTLVKGQKVIATFHPASIFRIFDNHGILQTDIRRCAEEADFREIRLPQRTFYIAPSGDVLAALIPELVRAEWLAVDIECFERADGSWEIACVGFSDRADRAVVIPCTNQGGIQAVALLCGCDAKKIFQNGQFDLTVLEDNGFRVKHPHAWDTMYAHHAIYPECAGAEDEIKKLQGRKTAVKSALGKGLAYQASVYTKEPFYKDDGKLWKQLT